MVYSRRHSGRLTLSRDWKVESESRSVVSDSLRIHGLYIVHGLLQTRLLEWVVYPFSRGSSQPRLEPRSPTLQVDSLPAEPQGKPIERLLLCIRPWPGEGNGNPLQCSCLENPRDRGVWWAAVYGVTQSRTRLKQLSSSSRHWPRKVLIYYLSLIPTSHRDPLELERWFIWVRSGINEGEWNPFMWEAVVESSDVQSNELASNPRLANFHPSVIWLSYLTLSKSFLSQLPYL